MPYCPQVRHILLERRVILFGINRGRDRVRRQPLAGEVLNNHRIAGRTAVVPAASTCAEL